MASENTLKLREIKSEAILEWVKKDRDRSLNGKKRIKARKEKNKNSE